MNEVKDKVVIVTGAGKGIGEGIATYFAACGAKVVIATISSQEGEELQRKLTDKGYQAYAVQTDVCSEESVINMVTKTEQFFGSIDTLVNNAGITLFKSILEATLEDWDRVINTDLRGVFLCTKYVAKSMINHDINGSIINISSNHAFRTLPDTEMYAAAKGGVNAMTRSMALSLGKYGIRVNCVCPGFTDTYHYQNWLADKDDPVKVEADVVKLHATGKISTPLDIAHMVAFLAGEASSNITGSEFMVDGGLTAGLYHADKF